MIETEKNVLGDYAGLLALTPMYCTGESFIKYDHEIRIQKIGDNFRALKRVSSNWKGNVGNTAIVEETKMKDHWKDWIIWGSDEFGGLDICAMDVLVTKDGKEYILEMNDTGNQDLTKILAIGLMNKLHTEDSLLMKDLTLVRMKEKLGKKNEPPKKFEEYKIQKLLIELEESKKREEELKAKIKLLEGKK